MSAPENPFAFPTAVQTGFQWANEGMTLRDWFAGQAMSHALSATASYDGSYNHDNAAQCAYDMADAMLAARPVDVPAAPSGDAPEPLSTTPAVWPVDLTPAEEATAKRCKANDTYNGVRGFCTTCAQPEADCECIPF
jgi:hypothetical protein